MRTETHKKRIGTERHCEVMTDIQDGIESCEEKRE